MRPNFNLFILIANKGNNLFWTATCKLIRSFPYPGQIERSKVYSKRDMEK
jgi:hypothetical protein